MVFGGGGRNAKPRDPSDEIFRKIFVGGLDLEVSTEGLCDYFAKFGEVVDCIVVKNPSTQRSKGFGFVTFKDADSVDNVQNNRPHVIQNKEVEVKRAMPRDESDRVESHVTTTKLFVGSLRKDATEEDLKECFAPFGDIESAEVARLKESGESRGFGFVTFTDYDSVDKAMLRRPHSVKSSLVDVRKGLSKEEMQRVRMRQMQQQQYHQQPHQQQQQFSGYQHPQQYQQQQAYPDYYGGGGAAAGWAGAGGPPGGFGYYGDQGGYGGGPIGRGGAAVPAAAAAAPAAGAYWQQQRVNPYYGGVGGGVGGGAGVGGGGGNGGFYRGGGGGGGGGGRGRGRGQ